MKEKGIEKVKKKERRERVCVVLGEVRVVRRDCERDTDSKFYE
jgi:hypothetical protein